MNHIWIHGPARFSRLSEERLPASLLGEGVLPSRFFHYFRVDSDLTPLLVDGRELIGIGYTVGGDRIGVVPTSLEVVVAVRDGSRIASVVNSSFYLFVEFLRVCESRYPYYVSGCDFDESEEAADQLHSVLAEIDSVALEPGTYWSDFLADVANGDYGEVSDEDDDD